MSMDFGDLLPIEIRCDICGKDRPHTKIIQIAGRAVCTDLEEMVKAFQMEGHSIDTPTFLRKAGRRGLKTWLKWITGSLK